MIPKMFLHLIRKFNVNRVFNNVRNCCPLSLKTKAYIKSWRLRPHHCLTQERTKLGTFGSITKIRFDSDWFYQQNF